MKLRKSMLLVVVLLIGALLLAGCGSASTDPGTDAADSGTPGEEKVFRYARSWEEASWDPALFGQLNDIELAMVVFETLTELDLDGKVIPCLAESWETAADGLSYTYHLRQGVQFHFGYGEMTSADVKFSIERNNDPEVGSKNIENLKMANFASIETPDEYTVVFNLKQPDPDFLTRMSLCYGYIISQKYGEEVGVAGITAKPVGTGPFMYDKGTPETHTEAVRFADYWGEPANIDRITNTLITDTSTGYAAIENGELEAISVYDTDKMAELKQKGFTVEMIPYLELLYLSSNMQIAPFDNPLVREAMFAAIDPQYFVDQIFAGTTVVPGSYVPPASKYAITDYFKSTYDPEKAKALLAEAGYSDGVAVTLWAPNDALSQTPAIIAQSQMAAAGFNVELQLVDFGVFIDKVRNGEAQMWLLY
ncbi:MAG: ABC transporter substrate-binding protein, partial [Clostridiales bacterium]